MSGNIRHFLHLLALGRVLGRHRLAEVLPKGVAPPFLLLLIQLSGLGTRRAVARDIRLGERLARIAEVMGPAYIKLGQVLTTRPDVIGDAVVADLIRLQDKVTPFPAPEARAAIEAALGKSIEELFQDFDDQPVAAASIAQVHKATTPDGRKVAVKVLRPGIEQRFARELAFFRWGAALLERHRVKFRRLRPVAVIDQLARSVAKEMDLRLEAAALSELAENMGGEPGYRLPALDWRRTAARVLTTEWIDGIALSDIAAIRAAGIDPAQIGHRLVTVFLKQSMRDGFFHADLHHGNILVTRDGEIAAVDFGIMGRLNPAVRRYLAEILYGFLRRDYLHIARQHFAAGYVPASYDVADFAAAMRAIGEPIMGLPVREISVGRLLAQLLATTEAFDMPTQPHLLLHQKTMMMVEGLAVGLDPEVNMWDISRPVLESWFRDNMAPEIRVADWIVEHARLLRKAPRLIEAAEKALERPAEPVPQPRQPQWGWAVAGLAILIAIYAFASS